MDDLVGKIIDFESGLMDQEEVISFFQELIDTGMAWTLQGSYGRTAAALIKAGYCQEVLQHFLKLVAEVPKGGAAYD